MPITYDRAFGLSPVGRLFRFRVAERVMSASPRGARILDIGCGTGEDAVWLAAQGYRVHGVDESDAMIEAPDTKDPAVLAEPFLTKQDGAFGI